MKITATIAITFVLGDGVKVKNKDYMSVHGIHYLRLVDADGKFIDAEIESSELDDLICDPD